MKKTYSSFISQQIFIITYFMQRFFEDEWDWKYLAIITDCQLRKRAVIATNIGGYYKYRYDVQILNKIILTKSIIQNLIADSYIWYNVSKHPTLTLQLIVENPTLPWNWITIVHENKFNYDKLLYVVSKTKTILLFTIMESCERRNPHSLVEYVYADWHIINAIKHFL